MRSSLTGSGWPSANLPAWRSRKSFAAFFFVHSVETRTTFPPTRNLAQKRELFGRRYRLAMVSSSCLYSGLTMIVSCLSGFARPLGGPRVLSPWPGMAP